MCPRWPTGSSAPCTGRPLADVELEDPWIRPGRDVVRAADAGPAALEDRLPAHPRAQELALARALVERREPLGLLVAEDPPRDRDMVDRAARQLDIHADLPVERDGDEQDVAGVREVEAEVVADRPRLAVRPLAEAQRARLGLGVAREQRAQDAVRIRPAHAVLGAHEPRRALALVV
jgi:hypothetical protein